MPDIPVLLICIIVVALIFDYTNGAHDTGNVIATVVSTNAMSPRAAVMMASILNFAGAMVGDKVAQTIGKGMINPQMIAGCRTLVLAALLGAIIWNIVTWAAGLPSSSSHALIGGLIGAAIAYRGWSCIEYTSIFWKVLVPIIVSPLAGLTIGFLCMVALSWLCIRVRPGRANITFRRLQLISSSLMAFSHGMNDAQKTMGILALALFLFNQIPAVMVPMWVKVACGAAIALGTATGGWKIIKTMGSKFFRIEPIHGFAIQTASAIVIELATVFGAPISTTHVISSAVLGVGASKRLSAVRWGVAGQMVIAWVLTLPASALIGAMCLYLLRMIFTE
ncbi:MAG: inorganic phosphate transporter [Deltaproteobacteria bacterium]|nr:inorganic phosphate transporter [Deltaproteobacteria bacterium]